MADINVSFPKPCSEQWDDMASQGCDRHCSVCERTIHNLSSMTADEAEALLDGDGKTCVRAKIDLTGTINFADAGGNKSRRMIAIMGASLSLATAACQTTPMPGVSPRYEIAGAVGTGIWTSNAILEAENGQRWTTRIDRDRKFRISNLKPGTYTLSFTGTCGEVHRFENILVSDSDVNTGSLNATAEEDCIIIGVFERLDDGRSG